MTIGHIIKPQLYNAYGRCLHNENEYAIPVKRMDGNHSLFSTTYWKVQHIEIEDGVLKLKHTSTGYDHWYRKCTPEELDAFNTALKDSRYVLSETGLVSKPIETLEELKQELFDAHLSERLSTAIKQLL